METMKLIKHTFVKEHGIGEIRTQVFTRSSNRSRSPVRRVNLKGTPIVKLERKRSPSANPGLKQKSNVLSHCPITCSRRSCLLEFAVSGCCIVFYPGQERSVQPSRSISAERNIQSTIVCTLIGTVLTSLREYYS
ncbi:hypothetical protein DPMN_065338 [Dreissena polymorpha]|uniref:Uncharacterized protein n=1 Tax=Dreissena polymorpha TaxID=45954 RepID=A0A9D4CEF4_DREPO|nr:hypothetical protein DPMN_065338 [Dreissena polymorpha]